MSLVSINWQPDRATLREFSEWWMFFLGMIAAPLVFYREQMFLAAVFWLVAVAGRLLGAWQPNWLKPVFLGLSLATWPIGWVISHVALAIVYYGVFTPVGLVFRLIGRDLLARRFDRQAESYWEAYKPQRQTARYFRQF